MKGLFKKISMPILISVFSAATIVGTSFALFTDSANTSISVTSGQIVTSLTMGDIEVYSAKSDTEGTLIDENGASYIHQKQSGLFFSNGGTVSATDTTISISNITPGDRVDGVLTFTNTSNINTKYRISLSVPEDDYLLASALDIKIGSVTTSALALYYSSWVEVDASSTPNYQIEVPFSFSLPINKGNEYQNKSCSYSFKVDTVQANAEVNGEEAYYKINAGLSALANTDVNVVTDSLNNTVTTLATNKNIETSAPNTQNSTVSVSIPSGVTLDNDATGLALVVAETEKEGNFQIEAGEEVDVAYNIDIDGLSSSNTSLISVSVPYNSSTIPSKIVHQKDDGSKEEFYPYSATNPNGFVYANGYITFKTATFSTFIVIASSEKVYFTNVPAWEHVYAYFYNSNSDIKLAWPGEEITENIAKVNEFGQDIMYAENFKLLDGKVHFYNNVVFNCVNDQTKDILNLTKGNLYWTTSRDKGDYDHYKYGTMPYVDTYKYVYFTNNYNWQTVKAYMWNKSSDTAWPGVDMEKVARNAQGQDIYRIDYGNYDHIIFNEGGNWAQTVDIEIVNNRNYYLTGSSSSYGVGYTPYDEVYCASITDAVNNASAGDSIKLANDIRITEPFVISNDFTLDLNGHNITYNEEVDYEGLSHNAFLIEEGATLNLVDTSGTKNYAKWDGDAFYISKTELSGYTEFTGGIICGGFGIDDLHASIYDTNNGGAIINRGTLNINGANIAGNKVAGNAAGISNLRTGTVNLISGSISLNKCPAGSGSAIYNDGGAFNMSGGEISYNLAYRGTIIVRGSDFNFTGGSIHDNETTQYAIDITGRSVSGDTSYGHMVMSGTASITDNVNTGSIGGAVFIRGGCTFTMNAGTISRNETAHSVGYPNPADYQYQGGAVVPYENAICELFGGAITDNIGGGVWCGDQGNRVRLKGSIRICDNYFEAEKTTRLDLFMDNWRGQCPRLVAPLTSGASIGLYEGHYLNDVDTYGCLLKVDYEHTAEEGAALLSYLYTTKADATLIYQRECTSNVNYWGGESYIRQVRL